MPVPQIRFAPQKLDDGLDLEGQFQERQEFFSAIRDFDENLQNPIEVPPLETNRNQLDTLITETHNMIDSQPSSRSPRAVHYLSQQRQQFDAPQPSQNLNDDEEVFEKYLNFLMQ